VFEGFPFVQNGSFVDLLFIVALSLLLLLSVVLLLSFLPLGGRGGSR
jgi:hypothetical protein